MLFGLIETLRERIQHLLKIRKLQSEKPKNAVGFLNFICWPVQSKDTKLTTRFPLKPVTPVEYVRTIAISRIVLNNIKSIQASWLTVGRETAQICLHAGANDLGSIMMEENVLAAVCVQERMDAKTMVHTIREAGFEPYLRDQHYQPMKLLTV
jgi:cyclic dehypoxanthinyl futalosine synthase